MRLLARPANQRCMHTRTTLNTRWDTTLPTVALDLDGTVVFSEPSAAGSLEIPGRSRSTYMSAESGRLLTRLSLRSNLILATARHAQSVWGLVRQLPEARFAGFVMECGWVTRSELSATPEKSAAPETSSQNEPWVSELAQRLPGFEVVPGYEVLVCCVPQGDQPSDELGEDAQAAFVRQSFEHVMHSGGWGEVRRLHQERHKTFLYPIEAEGAPPVTKLSGIRRLGVRNLHIAAGDDAVYDLDMLQAAKFPLGLPNADPTVLEFLTEHPNGRVLKQNGHAGAEELLQVAIEYC